MSPIIARLSGGLGACLRFAFQEVSPKGVDEPAFAILLAFARFAGAFTLPLFAHGTCFPLEGILNRLSLYHALGCLSLEPSGQVGRKGSTLAGAPPLWQGPPARIAAASRLPRADFLSRRSSVVEHVIGNDGVSSSILLGGTIIRAFARENFPSDGLLASR